MNLITRASRELGRSGAGTGSFDLMSGTLSRTTCGFSHQVHSLHKNWFQTIIYNHTPCMVPDSVRRPNKEGPGLGSLQLYRWWNDVNKSSLVFTACCMMATTLINAPSMVDKWFRGVSDLCNQFSLMKWMKCMTASPHGVSVYLIWSTMIQAERKRTVFVRQKLRPSGDMLDNSYKTCREDVPPSWKREMEIPIRNLVFMGSCTPTLSCHCGENVWLKFGLYRIPAASFF